MRVLLVLLALGLAGCAELYRWPDRMSAPVAHRTVRSEPAPEGHYVVKAGDTLFSIAFRNQLDVRELAVWNDIGPDYLIRVGQVIRLTPPLVVSGEGGSSIVTRPLMPPPAEEPAAAEPAPAVRGPASPSGSASSGSRTWPANGPVLRRFGEGGKGIDIGGEVGAPVRAAADGKVVYSGSGLKGYGELIIVKHDETYLTAYGNNSRRLVSEGVRVSAGQPIAEMGLGPEQRAALHFEVRRRGKPVDPAGFLPPR